MTEPAGHADTVRPNEIGVFEVVLVSVIALRIPPVLRCLVEIWIRKQAQAYNPGRIAIIGPNRQGAAVRESRAACPRFHARIYRLVFERVGWAIFLTHVEPQAESLRIGADRLFETGLVDCAQPAPTRIAVAANAIAVSLTRMRSDYLQQIEGGKAVASDPIPKTVIAAGPQQPHAATLHLVIGQGYAVVHGVKVIFRRVPKACLIATGCLRFIEWRGLLA